MKQKARRLSPFGAKASSQATAFQGVGVHRASFSTLLIQADFHFEKCWEEWYPTSKVSLKLGLGAQGLGLRAALIYSLSLSLSLSSKKLQQSQIGGDASREDKQHSGVSTGRLVPVSVNIMPA